MSQKEALFRLQEEASMHMDAIEKMVNAGEPEEDVLTYSKKLNAVNQQMAELIEPAESEIMASLAAIKQKRTRSIIAFTTLTLTSIGLIIANMPVNL
jgi:hypothetical protein